MFLINPYRFTTTPTFTGLMDSYPGARAAYSLRCLKTSFLSSAPIRIRRNTSPAIEADVYFDTNNIVSLNSLVGNFSGGSSTAVTLNDFVNVEPPTPASATVSLIRNQMNPGTDDLSQNTASQQPRLVNAGVLETFNGHVSMSFTSASNQYLYTPSAISTFSSRNTTMFLVAGSVTSFSSGTCIFTGAINNGGTTNVLTFRAGSSNAVDFRITATTSSIPATLAMTVAQEYAIYGSSPLGVCEVSITPTTNSTPSSTVNTAANAGTDLTLNTLQLGSRGSSSGFFNGYITEAIMYNTNQSSNRTAIQQNQLTAF